MVKKRKYTRRQQPAEETPALEIENSSEALQEDPAPVAVVIPEPAPSVEEKVKLCDCGNPANPGDHQCWRCSHRT